ncbi:MAG: VTT domain-containing protein [Endomicrobium sp.]|jgi:membrane protein YqaA with SNARE-associated domain|nr:VTT domain-containing protein [Endomicrobium sp.]
MKRIIGLFGKVVRGLYDWILHFGKTKYSNYALFVLSFLGSSVSPIPPGILLVPIVLADPNKWWKRALVCTLGSICGAFLGYAIGKFFYETVGIAIVNFYNVHNVVAMIGEKYTNNAFLCIFLGAITPIPYKIVTITAGMFNIPLHVLICVSILGRGGRFFVVSAALKLFGKEIQSLKGERSRIVPVVFLILLIVVILVFKYLKR